jgi:hypothetical protein
VTTSEDSTFYLTGGAVIPTGEVVLPTRTMIQHGQAHTDFEAPLWNEDEIIAQRPSADHYLVWAAAWVPSDVLDAS